MFRSALSFLMLLATASPALAQERTTVLLTKADLTRQGAEAPNTTLLDLPAGLIVEDVPLAEGLEALRNASAAPLAFSATRMKGQGLVSCICEDVTVGEALNVMLTGTEFHFSVVGNRILVERMATAVTERPDGLRERLARVEVPSTGNRAQRLTVRNPPARNVRTGTVEGRVVEAGTGHPLGGTQVQIAGTALGSLTDSDGGFSIFQVPAGEVEVRVQRVGYRTMTRTAVIQAGETVTVDFELRQEALGLDEIIVTGTPGGTQRRAVGNVVERLDVGSILERSAPLSVEQVLQSRMPGVNVVGGMGMAGMEGSPIRIRGSSSPGLRSDPIVYVDGVRMSSELSRPHSSGGNSSGSFSRLNDINPADIESVEVIKGPAAATLYGTEASNGVISIITKRGVSGEPVFDTYVGLGINGLRDPGSEIDTNWGRSETGEVISLDLYQAEVERLGRSPYSWGAIQQYGISVRGGSELFRYTASLNRSDRTGIVSWGWTENTSARMSLSAALSEQLEVTLSGSYARAVTRYPGDVNFQGFIRGRPETREGPQLGFAQHPIDGWRDRREDLMSVDRPMVSVRVSYQPRPWLTSRLVLGGELIGEAFSRTDFRDEQLQQPGAKGVQQVNTRGSTVDLASTASVGLTDQLTSATSIGLQYHKREVEELALRGDEWAVRALTTIGSAARTSADETFVENVTLGLYLQQQFDLAERIFLIAAVRADDNSAFGSDFDAAVYPKLSATWVMHEEPFWRWDFIDELRLRGAWGMAGQQPDVFAAQRQYRATIGPGDGSVMTPMQFGNPDLGPERGQELELGLDAVFWNERVEINFTRYWKTTKDAIVNAPLASSLGFPGSSFRNVGQISNWGSELSMDIQLVRRDDIWAGLGIGFATTRSRVDDLGDIDRLTLRLARHHIEGYPLAGFHDLRVLSAEFESGESGPVVNAMCDGGTGPDGRRMGGPPVPCAEAPHVYWGRGAEPTWSVNVNPTLTLLRNWRFDANIHAQGGNFIAMNWIPSRATSWNNSRLAVLQDDPLHQAYRQYKREPLGLTYGGFAKLREASVQYSLPAEWAERFGASRASVSLAGRNLALLWNESKGGTLLFDELTGDPEKTQHTDIRPGHVDSFDGVGEITGGGLPPLTSFLATVRITF